MHSAQSLFAPLEGLGPLPGEAASSLPGLDRPVPAASTGHRVLALTENVEVSRLLLQLGRRTADPVVTFRRTRRLEDALTQWSTGVFDVLVIDAELTDAREILGSIEAMAVTDLHPVILCGEDPATNLPTTFARTKCERVPRDELDAASLLHAIRYSALSARTSRAIEDEGKVLRRMQDAVIETLLCTIDLHDPITAGHQRRVADLAARIAEQLELEDTARADLVIAAKVHDIGKISVPSEITSKPSSLTPIEVEIMRGHVAAGHDVLIQANLPLQIAEAVYEHHERLDGSGYPRGLTGAELTSNARILCVADVFEAMTSHRPYRPAFSERQAMDFLREHSGRMFDRDVVAACRTAVKTTGDWDHRHSASFPLLSQARSVVAPGDTPGELRAYQAQRRCIEPMLGKPLSEMAVAMASQVEIKDAYTAGHQRRVADLSAHIADRLQLDDSTRASLVTAALLHDIGKVAIPNKILHKTTPLSAVEFELIKTHTVCGFEILNPVSFPGPVADVVLNHHERLDGSGYPGGLRDSAIPPAARIIAVADATEAMTFDRPYRPALGWDAAVRELRFGRKNRYDADAVDACIDVLSTWRREPGEGPWFS